MARVYGLFLALVAMLALLTTPSLGVDVVRTTIEKAMCNHKSPDAMNVIDQMCSREFFTSSPWPATPKRKNKHSAVIQANCKGNQWVPQDWCYAQFYEVCANGGKMGRGHKWFNSCQNFIIGN